MHTYIHTHRCGRSWGGRATSSRCGTRCRKPSLSSAARTLLPARPLVSARAISRFGAEISDSSRAGSRAGGGEGGGDWSGIECILGVVTAGGELPCWMSLSKSFLAYVPSSGASSKQAHPAVTGSWRSFPVDTAPWASAASDFPLLRSNTLLSQRPYTVGVCRLARVMARACCVRGTSTSSTLRMATHCTTGLSCHQRVWGAAEEGGCIAVLSGGMRAEILLLLFVQYVNPCPTQLCLIIWFCSV